MNRRNRREFLSLASLGILGFSMDIDKFYSKAKTLNLEVRELTPWEEGFLDIHHINTGRGDSTFFIFPDGTTLLIDAGALIRERPPHYDLTQRQDESFRPGQWIARYIQKFGPNGKNTILDYALITHFHGDHMGNITDDLPLDESQTFRLNGITDVGSLIPIKVMIDRGWPDYNYSEKLTETPNHLVNYQKFIHLHIGKNNMQVQRFKAGSDSQIRLKYKSDKFQEFLVQNIAVNGKIWTGERNKVKNRYPPDEIPVENNNSCVLKIKYGNFAYYTGGDIQTVLSDEEPAWHDMESAVASIVGSVDVMTLNHHGFMNTSNPYFLSELKPRVIIESVYAASHPGYNVLNHILSDKSYREPRDIFMLNGIWPGREGNMISLFGEEKTKWMIEQINKIAKFHGHVVIRVNPGGKSYSAYILNDNGKDYNILSEPLNYISKSGLE